MSQSHARLVLVIVCLFLSHLLMAGDIATPLEKAFYKELTSHQNLMQFVQRIASESDNVRLEIIGQSVEGRDIPALLISNEQNFAFRRRNKPIVLIYAQQHGDEPSGKEALLVVLRELAFGSLRPLLNDLNIILVPQVNPDGAERNQRRNANNMDLNRNHVILSEPESMALHSLFLKWMPEATLDIHETNASKKDWFCAGYMRDAEENFDGVSNLNIASEILMLSQKMILEVGKLVEKAGFRFSRYIVGGPPEVRRIRHSTTNINDGRQSMGIYNTFSFVLEGKRYDDVLSHIQRRTAGQVAAVSAILKIWSTHKDELLQITKKTRRQLLQSPTGKIGIQMEYVANPQKPTFTLLIFDLYRWQHSKKQLQRYEPMVKVKKSVKKPIAYVFSQKQTRLLQVLRRHQIKLEQLKKAKKLKLDAYIITAIGDRQEEDKPEVDVAVEVKQISKTMQRGDYLVYLSQPAGNLIPLLLEPQSSWGLVSKRSGRKYRFVEYLQNGQQYPIYRLE